ncbi:MAG: response regulator [Myxococcales bacterium]|nr:response regulator [Myxococcales bacterium]
MTDDDLRGRRLEAFRAIAAERLGNISLGWIELEHDPATAARTDAMLRELHTLKGEAGLLGLLEVADAVHALEELVGGAVRGAGPVAPEVGDRVLGGLQAVGAAIAGDVGASAAALAAFTAAASRTAVAAAPAGPAAPTLAAGPGTDLAHGLAAAAAGSVRIDVEQLDRIRTVVGDLVAVRHRLAGVTASVARARQHPGDIDDTLAAVHGHLRDDVRRLTAMATSLDLVVRDLRMVPIAQVLARIPLVARELARELGKAVRVVVHDGGVEADRAVLEELQAPLMHLVRNALDHGIEPAAERVAAGKPEVGTLTITADVRGSVLRLQLADDGGGIDVDLVRRRAVEQGLIEAPSARILSDEQVLAYLFSSGFSTRKVVTRVSGRGVGLDVVRATAEALGGTVHTASVRGRGTTFTLTAPVSALITSLLLTEIGATRYALPLAEVVALVPAADHPAVDSIDGPAVRFRGALVPLVPLPELLGEAAAPSADPRLVIARAGDVLMALAGTRRHRDRDAVVRSAGPVLDDNPYAVGGIDLEDGSVALVLGLGRMVTAARALAARSRHRAGDVAVTGAAKVLVVEDSVIMRDIIAEALRAHGVTVVEAGDGLEALAALEAHPDVGLVVTDLEMPGLDGFELIRRIRGQPRATRLPAVVISTRGSDADKLAAVEVGADAYLVKTDFTRDSLWSHVGRFLA